MNSRLHGRCKRAALLPLIVVLWATGVSANEPPQSLQAPAKGITVVYHPATGRPDRVSFVNGQGREIFSQDYSGSVYVPGAGQWTASGRFFLYPLLSRDHKAIFTNDRFDIVDIKTRRVFVSVDLAGDATTSEFKLSKRDSVTFYQLGDKGGRKLRTLSLSEVIPSLGGESRADEPNEQKLHSFYVGAATAQKTGICNIHRIQMNKILAPILWGLLDTSIGPLPSTEIRFFPHAQMDVNGGCQVDPAQQLLDGTLARLGRNEGVRKMVTAERAAVVGSPDLGSLTTSHIERAFLTVRQEIKRYQRKGLGYSKDLETHKQATALFLGVYNFVRNHKTLGTTPAVAAGVEWERWSLERVVEMTAEYMRRKEDAKFEAAFAAI